MKKAYLLVELLISVFLVAMLMSMLIILLINLNVSSETEIIQDVINRSEQSACDRSVTLNNGMKLEIVSKNGYLLEYLR